MPIYATKGLKALEDFLSTEGVKNIEAVNQAITSREIVEAESRSCGRLSQRIY